MSFEPEELVVAGTGHIWTAAVGTAFPANIDVAVNETLWAELGYTTETGCHFNFDRQTKDIMAWQVREAIRTIVTSEPKSIEFTLEQWNQNSFALANGGGTWVTDGAGEYTYTPPAAGSLFHRALIVEFTDDTKNYRFCCRNTLNKAPLNFSTLPNDIAVLPINMSILAATAGQSAYIIQTDDDNLGLATAAGS